MYNVLIFDKHGNVEVQLSDLTTLKCAIREDGIYHYSGQNNILSLIQKERLEINLPQLIYIWKCMSNVKELKLNAPNLITSYEPIITNDYSINLDFSGDLTNLICGDNMFSDSRVENFISVVPRLVSGNSMFERCKLNPKSVTNILFSLRDINELREEKIELDEAYTKKVNELVNDGYSQENAEEKAEKIVYPEIGWLKNGNYRYLPNV